MCPKITRLSQKGTNSSQKYYSIKKKPNSNNVQTIIVEKGTKKIRVMTHSIIKEKSQTDIIQKIVCDSCKNEIGPNICKVLVMLNKDEGPQVLHYHFFFPCWNFELLCSKYSNFTLERVGVSIPENIVISKMEMIDLQNNLEYWK